MINLLTRCVISPSVSALFCGYAFHCFKNVRICSFFWSVSPAFELNTDMHSENLRIRPNAAKYEPEKLQIRTLFRKFFTEQNTKILSNFLAWNFLKKHSFRRVSDGSPKTLRKLLHSTKFQHQEIRWNFGILCRILFWTSLQVSLTGNRNSIK